MLKIPIDLRELVDDQIEEALQRKEGHKEHNDGWRRLLPGELHKSEGLVNFKLREEK